MPESPSADPGILAAFLALYVDDQERRRKRSPRDYAALFPGHEDAVAREAALLAGEGTRGGTAASEPASAAREPEPRILGPYTLVRELGRGGQGTVWLARDDRLGRQVALKILRGLGPCSEEAMARFRREAAIASRLDDPGICTVFDAGVHDAVPWIAMRYLEGESLAAIISRRRAALAPAGGTAGPAAESDATRNERPASERSSKVADVRRQVQDSLRLFEQVARSLHAAHEAGVIHRDIKPANVLVTPQGLGVIMDFGLAHADHGDLETLTRTGDVFGTPAYMSPEQLAPERTTLDRRTDVWSLAVALYECLTLRRPFEAPTREAIYQAILLREPPDPTALNRALPGDLRVILETALEKDRNRRYPTAHALAQDLAAVREGRPISVRPVSLAGRAVRWARRAPARAALVGLLVVAVLAAAGLGGYLFATLPEMRSARALREAEEIEDLVDSGLMSLLSGDRSGARTSFEGVLARRPGHPEAIAGLVAAHLRLFVTEGPVDAARGAEDAGTAFACYASGAAGEDPELGWIQAFVLREQGKIADAEALEARLARDTPKTGMRHLLDAFRPFFLGWYGDQNAARRSFESVQYAILRSPRPRLALYWVYGEVANFAGRADVAKVTADVVRCQWPRSAETLMVAGVLLPRHEHLVESIACLEEAVRLNPGLGFAWTILAERKGQLGDWTDQACEGALPDARRAIAVRPGLAYAHYRLASLLRSTDRLDEALAHARAAVEADPQDAIQHYELGQLRELLADRDGGDYRPALESYEEGVRLGLDRNGIHARIARVLAKLGRYDDADAHVPVAVRFEPESHEVFAELAWVLAGAGLPDRGRAVLEAWVAGSPESADRWNLLAWFLVAPGAAAAWRNTEEGLTLARKADALSGGKEPAILNTLGVAWYRCGDAAKALESLLEADRLGQEQGRRRTATDHAFIALALDALGRPDEARAALDLARRLPRMRGERRDERDALLEAASVLDRAGSSH